jgi:hypothetical protein
VNGQPIGDQTWAGIRTEFTLPTLQQVRRRLSELMEDPEPVMQQLVRVFLSGQLHPTVVELFGRALELQIPHNYFTVWMITPSRELGGARPADLLKGGPAPLLRALETYRWR